MVSMSRSRLVARLLAVPLSVLGFVAVGAAGYVAEGRLKVPFLGQVGPWALGLVGLTLGLFLLQAAYDLCAWATHRDRFTRVVYGRLRAWLVRHDQAAALLRFGPLWCVGGATIWFGGKLIRTSTCQPQSAWSGLGPVVLALGVVILQAAYSTSAWASAKKDLLGELREEGLG